MSIDKTNFFSYIYSSWVTTYLWKAYRTGINLSSIPPISPLDSCSCNIRKFENLWNEELRERGPSSASLLIVVWKFIRLRILISCILNASSQIAGFVLYTVFLRKLFEYSENSERHILSGIYWIIYIIVFDFIQMILFTWSDIMNQRTALRIKSACLSLLFKKILNSNNIAHRNKNELMNMLLNDGHKIYDAVNFGTSIVNGPVITLCTVIYISICLKPLALMGLITFVLFYFMQNWLTHLLDYCTQIASEYTNSRMQKTMELIKNIKLVKINGWEELFIRNILSIRNNESRWLFKAKYLQSLNSSMTYATPFIAIISTFIMHFLTSSYLKASEAFPICIVFIVQLHGGLLSIKKSLLYIKEAKLAINRIKTGLLLDDTSNRILKPYELSQALTIINASFAYDICKEENFDAKYTVSNKLTNIHESCIALGEKQHLTSSALEPKRKEVLSNISFKARKGQLIGVYGSEKSGQSSLLLAALGQIRITSGQLMRQGTCAYVAQKAWLINATLGENILFGESYDAKRYYEAQVVCKLRPEMKSLPLGDNTQLGDEGIQIPETFKQKIALARAFYADRDIYFLDDPLSGMEDKVANEIFEDLIIRALAEKTIIFVTRELKHINRCDYMYIMRDGKIAEHGRHKELMRLGREYASLVKSETSETRGAEGDYSNESYNVYESEYEKIGESEKPSIAGNLTTEYQLQETNYAFTNKHPVESEQIIKMTYYNYVKSYGDFLMFLPITLSYIAFTASGLVSILILVRLIEAINSVDNEPSVHLYKNWYGSCIFFMIFGCLLRSFVVQYTANKIANNFHNALLNKFIYAPVFFFNNASSKIIEKVFLHDLNNVSLTMPPKLDSTLLYVFLVVFNFFILISTIPWFTNYIVFASLFFFIVGKIYRVIEVNLKHLENTQRLPNFKFLHNVLQGLTTIRTFKKENELLNKFQDLVDESSAYCFLKGIAEKWFLIRLQFLTTASIFVAAYFIVILKENVSSGIAGLTFIYVIQMPNIIQKSMKYFTETEPYFLSVQNIYTYFQTLVSENNNKIPDIIPDAKWPARGLIRFDNVELRNTDNTDIALDRISFTIINAEKIGVVSQTDSCKNSLIAAIFRLSELSSGMIYIDSVDISRVDIKLLRNQLLFIPKNPIFHGTIRFFLDPKMKCTDAEIWSTLEKVQLKDKISSITSQLLHWIDEKTFRIWEKQLLFLAKACLHHQKILMLEENDTNDTKATTLLFEVIDKEFSNITVLILAECLSTILSCNRVLVMEGGRILEFDSPSALMDNQDSNLRRMWRDAESDEKT